MGWIKHEERTKGTREIPKTLCPGIRDLMLLGLFLPIFRACLLVSYCTQDFLQAVGKMAGVSPQSIFFQLLDPSREFFIYVIEISEESFCSSFSHMLISESIIIARVLCQGGPRLIFPEARVMGYCDWQHGLGEESKEAQFLQSRDWTFGLSYLCQSIRALWAI